ncbi:MAG: ArnT family glycosyltransferase [Candidatus Brocadiales bacterium]
MNELLRKELPWVPILTVLCLFLYLPCLGNRDLWGSVEPQYAEVAREAVVDGYWVVPHFNGVDYTIKPPLYPWLIAIASIPIGDVTEFTARLPSALSALGMVLVVYLLGNELFSQRVGLLAALILASSPQFYKSACMVRIDMPLAFFATSSLFTFYLGFTQSKNIYYYLGGFFAALAALIKGPLVPLMIAAIALLYLYSRKELRVFSGTRAILTGCVFVATITCWLLPAYLEGGHAYVNALFRWLEVYATGEIHSESFYFYLLELFGLGPWALLIPVAISTFYKNKAEGLRLPCIWFLVMLTIFSMITSKHSRYLLPLYPAAALLAAVPLDRYLEKSSPAWQNLKAFPLLLFAVIVGIEIALLESHSLPTPALSLALGAVCLLAAIYFALRGGQYRLIFGAIFLVLIAFGVSRYQFLMPRENEKRSEKALCQGIVSSMAPGAEWAVYKGLRSAHTFYTKTYPKSVNSETDLVEFFSSKERVYCLIREEQLQGLKLSVTEVARLKGPAKHNSVFILISNRPTGG